MLNFSSERATVFLTSALFSSIKDGQSGQTSATLAAGTEQGKKRGLGWKKKTVRRDLKEVTEKLKLRPDLLEVINKIVGKKQDANGEKPQFW